MDQEKVIRRVMQVIRESTETEEELSENTTLYEELGLASVELYVLLCDLEDAFGITISAAALREVRTVGEICQVVNNILD